MEFSKIYLGGNAILNSDSDLNDALLAFRESSFSNLKLWEFYVIDVSSFLKEFANIWEKTNIASIKKRYPFNLSALPVNEKAELLEKDALQNLGFGQRFSKILDIEISLAFISQLLIDGGSALEAGLATRELESIMNVINLVFYKEYDYDAITIFDQIRSRAHYLRIAEGGPKLGMLSQK